MIDTTRLVQKCSMWNISLTPDQLTALDKIGRASCRERV